MAKQFSIPVARLSDEDMDVDALKVVSLVNAGFASAIIAAAHQK